MRRLASVAALLLAVGCTPLPQPSSAVVALPPDAIQGAGDPVRAAVNQSSFVFANPAMFRGRGADVARAVANQEFLAIAVPQDPRFVQNGGNLPILLSEGRTQARATFGIAGNAEPQMVINSLYSASRALSMGDRLAAERALSSPAFANGAETLRTLEQSPRVPDANVATSRTAQEIFRQARESHL